MLRAMQKSGSEPLIGEGIEKLFGGLGSDSSPSLGLSKTVACNLREYSLNRARLKLEKPEIFKDSPLEIIDLHGGNGRWRQRKAKVEFAKRAIEEEEARRQSQLRELERRRRKAEQERTRKQAQEMELNKRKKEREQKRLDAIRAEEKRREAEENERLRKQHEHEEWLRRQPKMCETCQGTGKCQMCGGKGYDFVMFLIPEVSTVTSREHGKVMQGCEECGGLRHNIVGDLRLGSGKCVPCAGVGKVTPVIEDSKGPSRRKYAQMQFGGGSTDHLNSPNSPGSPKTPGGVW